MPLPLSRRQREWDNSRFSAYGYGWRLSDVDGVLRVAHTGTLTGMYSAIVLLPERKIGFVLLINGDGADARTVLSEVLVKHFTAPRAARPLKFYADEIAAERRQRNEIAQAALPAREPATLDSLAVNLGVYRDPWFGEVAICPQDGRVRFAAAKSPLLTGTLMRAGGRVLVDWHDDSVDVEAWLEFSPSALTLSKVDPDADFSYDYEDLLFTRARDCP
jgi:hypothetical protein